MAVALVVDDDQVTARIVEEAVEDSAIEVLDAHSVEEGESLFGRRSPDVLLVDIWFPRGSGLEWRGESVRSMPRCRSSS